MRSSVIKIYKSLHTWTGILAGTALFIAFFAGALTMFNQPIAQWLSPPSVSLPALAPQQTDSLIQKVVAAYPGAGTRMKVFVDSDAEHSPIQWQQQGIDSRDDQWWHASLDENGQLIAEPMYQSTFADFIDMLHQTAGIPGVIGHEHIGVLVMGGISLLYFVALISGTIILLPTLAKDFMAMRRNGTKKRLWLDAHNALGITSLPFHILIAFTAIVFAFHDPIYGALKVTTYGDKPLFARPAGAPIENQSLEKLLSVETLLHMAHQHAPDFEVKELEYFNVDSKRVMLRLAGEEQGEIVRGPYYGYLIMQPYSGEILSGDLVPGQHDLWSGIVASFFALHFGSFGGDFVRWLYFFLGIAGAFVFYSGNLLWLESRRQRLRREQTTVNQNRSAKIVGALSIGVCLGSMAGVGLSLLSAKWLYGLVDDVNLWHSRIYYGVFLVFVVWGLIRGAGRSAVPMLVACGLIALAIPITSLLTSGASVWGVDMVALSSGLIMLYFAKLTQRRVQQGEQDSIWARSAF